MSNICKTVSLRTRKIKDGSMLSYYLDYYPGYRDESTMKSSAMSRLASTSMPSRRTRRNRSTTSTLRQERGDTLPPLRGHRQRALRFLR